MHEVLSGRPGDVRAFSIGGILKGGLGLLSRTGIPGISQGAAITRSFLGGGSRNRAFTTAVARQQGRFQGFQQSRFPSGRGPLETQGAARQFAAEAAQQTRGGRNGSSGCGVCCTAGGSRAGHTNRTGYYVQSVPGNPEAGGTWVGPGTVCVSNRRRNFFNGRANSHALTRLTGWARNTKRLRKAVKALEVASR